LNMGKTFSKANHSTDGADDNYNYNQKFHGQMNPNQILNTGSNNYFI